MRRSSSILAAALLAIPMAGGATAEPVLTFEPESGVVRLEGLSRAPDPGTEAELLSVRVVSDPPAADVPAMAGGYTFEADALTFRPRFGFDPGLRYRAAGAGAAGVLDFEIPSADASPSTVVEAVFPESPSLPENHLRFYLHFSAPMSRGYAAGHVRLLDAMGEPLVLPFLDLAEELWDPDGTRLTLLLDPGRVKRGLVPHEEFGPVLTRGNSYTLEIDTGFRDAKGTTLREGFQRTFRVEAPDEAQPDISRWSVTPPPAGTREPVVVGFDQPLDHAMILRMIEIRSTDGQAVAGEVTADAGDSGCRFVPDASWPSGAYRIRVNRLLEDSAGNSLARPFERKDKTFAPHSLRTHVFVEFEIPQGAP